MHARLSGVPAAAGPEGPMSKATLGGRGGDGQARGQEERQSKTLNPLV
ncbi:MAG: hypothetical protein ACPIOQ_20625 [Promethearchaeia archaeon]